jgi:murein DD-endopeptidase MepM/ murein hydrolase activator NlpD
MPFDWKTREPDHINHPRRTHRLRRYLPLLLILPLLAGALLLFDFSSPPPTEVAPAEIVVPEIRERVVEGTIQPGTTLSGLLAEYFTEQEMHSLTLKSRTTFPLSDICAGQPYKLCTKGEEFERFEYEINQNEQLIINREENGFDISRIPIEYEMRTETVRGSIISSLFEAIAASGESAELAMILADIFAYDIDFIRDIRQGDTYQVVVEKRFREGMPAGYGRILAGEFINQGKSYQAFLFRDGKRPAAYYNAKGESLRTAFLRAPLAFSRISSGFTLRRFHPIAKTWRAHPAIDYAAPRGTPIMSVGDGSIIQIGRKGGNGNYIKIRHNNGYETMYLHMSRFAKGMRSGKRIAQGNVIGYVGSTGLATGPHLCFRMFKNGSPTNPNKVRTAAAAPVSKENRGAFQVAIAPLVARLEGINIEAQAEPTPPDTATSVVR